MSETVYISGPMTGYVDFNRQAFRVAERRLRNMGFEDIVNPASLDDADESDNLPHSYYMRRDIEAMLDCDAIYMLPGWRYSKGAQVEHKVAEAIGLREIVDPNPAAWRCLEGEPECGCPHPKVAGCDHDDHSTCEPEQGDGLGNAWCAHGKQVETADLSVGLAPGIYVAPAGTEDLSDHPRWGKVADADQVLFNADDLDVVVDDSLPPDTLRLEFGGISVDYRTSWDDDGSLRLHPKSPLDTAHNEGVRA